MIGISFHSGGLVDKPLPWVIAHLGQIGYDAIEITPPKGRYGLGVKIEHYVETHRQLKADFGLAVSCINECWGEMWDPYSPTLEVGLVRLPPQERRDVQDLLAQLLQIHLHHRTSRNRLLAPPSISLPPRPSAGD